MTPLADSVLADALRLPEVDRGALAAKLIESLEDVTDADAESAWNTEIKNRLDELDDGAVRTLPWSEARRLILEDDGDDTADA